MVVLISPMMNPKRRSLVQVENGISVRSECCYKGIEKTGEDLWLCSGCENVLEDGSSFHPNITWEEIRRHEWYGGWQLWLNACFGLENAEMRIEL